MGEKTGIEWTDHTFNPWWGCEKISPGCANCYAATLGLRFGVEWGGSSPRRFFGEKHWKEPRAWDRLASEAGERRRVFCASMGDLFEHRQDLVEPRADLVDLIYDTPNLDWLLLTKRPEHVAHLLGWAPLPSNAWLGVSGENQELLESRFADLLRVVEEIEHNCDERILFLSLEPLLGPIVLPPWVLNVVDWVIVGGESGARARPMRPSWVRAIHEQCAAAGVPFFFKQWGNFVEVGQMTDECWAAVDANVNLGNCGTKDTDLYGVGKKLAGSLLDGTKHQEFPSR